MKIQALRSMKGDYGRVRKGDIFSVSDRVAKNLSDRGLAVMVDAIPRPKAGSKNPAAQKADDHPLAGSRDGAAKPSSSSRVVQAPRKPASEE